MAETDQPMVSIIAPCRNEVSFIEKAIRTILDGDYPADRMELLVVDGMSTDGTREVVKKIAEQDERVRLIDNPEKIVPISMNKGIKAAKGQYILRIDAHAKYSSDYIKSCVEVLKRTGAGCVGGCMETLPGSDTLTAKAIALATSSRFGVGGSRFRIGCSEEQETDALPFGAFRREVFEKVGFYNPLLVRNQDIELYSRIRKAGFKVIISPRIKLRYYNRETFQGLRNQAFSNGKWNAYTLWIVRGGLRLRHLIPAIFVLGLTGLLALALAFHGVFTWLLLGYVGIYLCTGTFEASRICFRVKQLSLLPFILLSFSQMHLWYGCGTIWGVITAPFKSRKGTISDKDVENAGR